MAALTKSDIEHVARLAKLPLRQKEIEKFTKELSEVVNYVSELNEVNTSSTQPTSQTTGLENVKRVDEIKTDASLTQDQALSGTDKIKNGYFLVPGILEERTDK